MFLGRGWQHVAHEAPWRAFFIDQELLGGPLAFFGVDWTSYATSLSVDTGLKLAQKVVGVFLYVCAVVALLLRPHSEQETGRHSATQVWAGRALLGGAACLVALSFCYFLDSKRQLGQGLEYWSQWGCVVALYWASRFGFDARLWRGACLAIAMTFFGHGLYALGYYETPGTFVTMVSRVFPVSSAVARDLLLLAGVLDMLVVAVLLASSWKPRDIAIVRAVLAYATFWGLVTAFARVVTTVRLDFFWESLSQSHFETLVRLVHGLLPLCVLVWLTRSQQASSPGREEPSASQERDVYATA